VLTAIHFLYLSSQSLQSDPAETIALVASPSLVCKVVLVVVLVIAAVVGDARTEVSAVTPNKRVEDFIMSRKAVGRGFVI
jgi:hypothetical protein